MRAQEFIAERDEWMHMDPPEVARWREQARVQGITSGPESTFSMTAPTNTHKDSRLPLGPNSPFAASDSQSGATANKKYNSELYKGAPNDEYRAAAPKKWGGKQSGPDQTELQKRKSKYSTEISPEYLIDKQGDWLNPPDVKPRVDPSKPGGDKEKYRT
jgi:hypothetical protein